MQYTVRITLLACGVAVQEEDDDIEDAEVAGGPDNDSSCKAVVTLPTESQEVIKELVAQTEQRITEYIHGMTHF